MIRCFIAIDLPFEIKEEIIRIQNLLKKKNIFFGNFTEPENLHLTLKFLGEISEEQVEEVKKGLAEINLQEFYAELGKIGVFSKTNPKIIWLKFNSKFIYELQKQIDNKLKDLFCIEKRFMSHITIGRIKHISNKLEFFSYFASIKPKKIKVPLKSFSLKKSELFPKGPVYTDISEYNLGHLN